MGDEFKEKCVTAEIVYEERGPWSALKRCVDINDWLFRDKLWLWTNNPVWGLHILEWLEEHASGLMTLLDLVVEDLGMLRGSHDAKNRCIARLRKLLRLAEELLVDLDGMAHYVSLYRLLGLRKLEKIVGALAVFRDYPHSVRDKVHELAYPHIRRELEKLRDIWLFIHPQRWLLESVWIECTLDVDTWKPVCYIKWERRNGCRRIDWKETLKKIIEREERKAERKRLERDEWKQLALLKPIPKILEGWQS